MMMLENGLLIAFTGARFSNGSGTGFVSLSAKISQDFDGFKSSFALMVTDFGGFKF